MPIGPGRAPLRANLPEAVRPPWPGPGDQAKWANGIGDSRGTSLLGVGFHVNLGSVLRPHNGRGSSNRPPIPLCMSQPAPEAGVLLEVGFDGPELGNETGRQ